MLRRFSLDKGGFYEVETLSCFKVWFHLMLSNEDNEIWTLHSDVVILQYSGRREFAFFVKNSIFKKCCAWQNSSLIFSPCLRAKMRSIFTFSTKEIIPFRCGIFGIRQADSERIDCWSQLWNDQKLFKICLA